MDQDPHYRLDKPVWYAVNEIHNEFALGNTIVKRYQPSIAPFVAFKPGHEVDKKKTVQAEVCFGPQRNA